MTVLHTSNLSDIKSVFSNEEENIYYYEVLTDTSGIQFLNVEFAAPSLMKSSGTVTWHTSHDGDYINFKELDPIHKDRVAGDIKDAFKEFKSNKINKQRPDFLNKFMEIPSEKSIYLDNSSNHIVITEWGFLLNTLNPPNKVMEHLFPADEYSIVVEVISSNGDGIPDEVVRLNDGSNEREVRTDGNGFARLGQVLRGKDFDISSPSGSFSDHTFTSVRNSKYTIRIPQYINIDVEVKRYNGELVPDFDLVFESDELGTTHFQTNEDGHCRISHLKVKQPFFIKNLKDEVIYQSDLPEKDTKISILLDIDDKDNQEEGVDDSFKPNPDSKEEKPFKVKLNGLFGRPKKNLKTSIYSKESNKTEDFFTNEQGIINSRFNSEGSYTISFNSFGEDWKHDFNHTKETDLHTFGIRPVFPWLWWLLILVLLILLIFCWNNRCVWRSEHDSTTTTDIRSRSQGYGDINEGPTIDERRQIHGGRTGEVTVTLAWNTIDDLDLLVTDPYGETIYFGNSRSRSGGELDIDMNRTVSSTHPVENIVWLDGAAPYGEYAVYVMCYEKRVHNNRNSSCWIKVKLLDEVKEYIIDIPEQNRDVPVLVDRFTLIRN